MCACLWGWSSLVIYNSLQAALIYAGANAQLASDRVQRLPRGARHAGWPPAGTQVNSWHRPLARFGFQPHAGLSHTNRAGDQLAALMGYPTVPRTSSRYPDKSCFASPLCSVQIRPDPHCWRKNAIPQRYPNLLLG